MPGPSSAAGTASSTSRSTARPRTRPRGRGAGPRSFARAGSKIRSGRSGRWSRRRSRRAGSAARPSRSYPGLRCTLYPVPIRIVYTDQNLRTSYTQHFSGSLQRQFGANFVVGGGLRRQDRQQAGRPQLLQRGAVHQLADHRAAPDAAERRAAGAAQPRDHQRAVARAGQLLPQHVSQPAIAGRNAASPGASRSRPRTPCRRT